MQNEGLGPSCAGCKVYPIHNNVMPRSFSDALFCLSHRGELLQLTTAVSKGSSESESTSREGKTEADELSILPSLPENLKVTGFTTLSAGNTAQGISQERFY